MSEQPTCKHCNQPIHWHKSKAGKPYPCDSEDRRDFHQCLGPKPTTIPPAQPSAKVFDPRPAVPPRTLEERVSWLEAKVRETLIKVDKLVEANDEGIGW